MAVIPNPSNGGDKFGVDATYTGFVVESYSRSQPSTLVELNDGDGSPIGKNVIAERIEVSATIQIGADGEAPDAGDSITIGGDTIFLTDVTVNETNTDYQRFDISGNIGGTHSV